ncbi:MAG: Lrp/AsnC ligand binding domain-containing protein [Acidipropionibacterium acidipropionici]|jgi:DNA-binding Lrp family transcriptional regulator|uniref:AsnC family transcriptional regulator n=2 Tax=Acidipropionibacterium acidipropionici TaxID=1748 RepID=A0A142KKV9_9ACTN|nr:Lrp/AsnC ligand binding domain-containing protein [Acidipropionibacterium acidipropionici]AFV89059.1 Putative transcriptional regulator [Acidipropionibacterium acidipropionici ATCC 4875]ALN16362.1 AsnC family transcriptional regulator [Acidipropionibacterium acidipropionici]AMS06747.1 AsnC family transcriptional regulator [Acidipropionibacterium acidipropionici]AOZ45537.1 AsnC family transcriptional regulator [Acidipropionibacterium acidipropionici]APZ10586.1 AsnC family transcriptional reg
MFNAIVLIQASSNRIPEVAQEVLALPGVSEVYSTAGHIDLIAMVRASTMEEVAEIIADRINKVEGVVDTDTHIALRTYSEHDLEAMFSIGD